MRRAPVLAAVTACAAAPVLWVATPAFGQPGYPPTGPGGGGGGASVPKTFGGGAPAAPSTLGGGAPTLPRTGQDLLTPVEVGAAALVAGVGLLVAAERTRPSRRRRR